MKYVFRIRHRAGHLPHSGRPLAGCGGTRFLCGADGRPPCRQSPLGRGRGLLRRLCRRSRLFRDQHGHGGRSWKTAAFNGALFGFFCYLTYDATNLAVLKGYDPLLAVVDTVWGTVLSAVTAGATLVVAWLAWPLL